MDIFVEAFEMVRMAGHLRNLANALGADGREEALALREAVGALQKASDALRGLGGQCHVNHDERRAMGMERCYHCFVSLHPAATTSAPV